MTVIGVARINTRVRVGRQKRVFYVRFLCVHRKSVVVCMKN